MVILLNMGGASNLDEVPVFLNNMFSDKNILPIPFTPIRKMVAKIITNRRYKSSQENYKLIGSSSPLLKITQKLSKKLEEKTSKKILIVNRYTPPFSKDVLEEIEAYEPDLITLLPMYPQYSITTSGSSLEDINQALNNKYKTRTIEPFYDNQQYIDLLVQKLNEKLTTGYEEFTLIYSAHALPKSVIEKGDPYVEHTEKMVELLNNTLTKQGISFKDTILAYQSKLGPVEWTKPYLSDVIKSLSNEKVIILPLSFTIDNLETLFELDIEYREEAEELNIEDYRVVECPNDSEEFVEVLTELL
ncbi:MAG: ferrochelatase [Campylobacterales bacterium]|nr:ferrochelatase [Campylobacterales bacterium]